MFDSTVSKTCNSHHRATGRRALHHIRNLVFAFAVLLGLAPSAAWACACGCSVFDVGGGLLPQEDDHGGRVFFEWWYADQNQNWIGASRASADANLDKRVVTNWATVGFQYMLSREWGFMVKAPYADRSFATEDPATLALNHFPVADFGDVEIMGMYTGFSKDMSNGIMFGLKLPSGNYTAPGFDRDTQLGSGSTDLILGGFHRGMITGDNAWQ